VTWRARVALGAILLHQAALLHMWTKWSTLERQLPPECHVDPFEMAPLEVDQTPAWTYPTSKGGPIEL
jgi:hypothetical protein